MSYTSLSRRYLNLWAKLKVKYFLMYGSRGLDDKVHVYVCMSRI